jgi:hypothetical protein
MIRHPSRIFILILLAALSATAAKQKTIEQLKARIEKTTGGRQAQAYAELAERMVGVADRQFTQGQSAEAHKTVQELFEYATHAHDISLETRKKRKEVEINLRETQRHLGDLRRTLASADRPALEEVEKKLGVYRQDLLDSMFAPKKKKEKNQ